MATLPSLLADFFHARDRKPMLKLLTPPILHDCGGMENPQIITNLKSKKAAIGKKLPMAEKNSRYFFVAVACTINRTNSVHNVALECCLARYYIMMLFLV